MEQEMERDLIELTDENDQKTLCEILDTFFYNGQEYALLADANDTQNEDEDEIACFVMQVNTIKDENGEELDEFVSLDDPDLEDRVFEIAQTRMTEDEEMDEE